VKHSVQRASPDPASTHKFHSKHSGPFGWSNWVGLGRHREQITLIVRDLDLPFLKARQSRPSLDAQVSIEALQTLWMVQLGRPRAPQRTDYFDRSRLRPSIFKSAPVPSPASTHKFHSRRSGPSDGPARSISSEQYQNKTSVILPETTALFHVELKAISNTCPPSFSCPSHFWILCPYTQASVEFRE
jgi:hypothetical protein